MQTVNEIMAEELTAAGLDVEHLAPGERDVIQALPPGLDNALTTLDGHPYGMRVAAAALRSYARVAEQYAAALDAHADQ